ncbi:MAG: cation-translocating P-type ATPase [Rubrivivax sp.]|nr:MAG: cation-translocating P-type ATPase [Rubrivivax sp.]
MSTSTSTPLLAADARPFGLTDDEAARRLFAHGPNELQDREKHGFGKTLASIVAEPMFLLLLVAAAIYLVLGDLGEGLLLSGFALVTVGLVLLQERRSERALDALRELAAPHVRVVRNGRQLRIAARELVPGDVYLVAEGERVAADGSLQEAVGLMVDESLLTGESVPVTKQLADSVSAGTLVVGGHAVALVQATGRETRVGHIGASLAGIETAPTPLQQQLAKLVKWLGVAALAMSTSVVLGYGLMYGDWMQGVLAGIALGMAMLPEEFPMALAIFMALGAWRLARVQVLSRRPAVIEALGAATVLCVDKTGTLTENRMRVAVLVLPDGAEVNVQAATTLPAHARRLLEHGVLASRRSGTDPMDRALTGLGDTALAGTQNLHPDWPLLREYPLSAELLALTMAWRDKAGALRLATKGAPEAIFGLCRLPAERVEQLQALVRQLASRGLRVLAVAQGGAPGREPPMDLSSCSFELLGLLAFEDPLRASVPGAVAQAREAGIAVAMITGDHAATALAIAAQAGIDVEAGALLGRDIDTLDDAALGDAVRRVRVFARVLPEHKLRLVQALRRNGEVVAMTGDGVNDAPALKAAHIGIAMGGRGTDVAREAAGLVLLDDDFGRIVGGVRMGRRIYDNLRKVMVYIAAIHVPVAGLALLPLLFGLPPLMLPAHVVLTEMVIDPVCSLAFEGAPESRGLMQRPPRAHDEGLVGWPLLCQALAQGGCLLAATLLVYVAALHAGRDVDVARTLAVVGLTAGNLLLVAANISAGSGVRAIFGPGARAFWGVAAAATSALVVATLVPAARQLLHFGEPAPRDLALCLGLVTVAVGLGTMASRWRRPGWRSLPN